MTRLSAALARYPWTAPILDGEVEVKGFELDFPDAGRPIVQSFRRMARDLAYDISELSWYTYLIAREFGRPITAVPVFPLRRLSHGLITVNRHAGIAAPGDLEGKRVGVRGYSVTPGVFARAMLAVDFGVDLDAVSFVCAEAEHVPEYSPPSNVRTEEGADLGAMLRAGAIDAVIIAAPADGDLIVPLLADPAAVEDLWRARGWLPVNHVVTVTDEVSSRHPDLAGALADAFETAAELCFRRGAEHGFSAEDRRAMAVAGASGIDSLPNGVDVNRAMLEASLRFGLDQKVLTASPPVDSLFVDGPRP